MTKSKPIQIELRKEGLRFLELGVAAAIREPCARDDIRLATVYCWTAVELLYKDLLHREHWTLLIERPSTANINQYQYGEIQSVSFDECLTRLAGILKISTTKKDKNKLNSLRRHRNRLVHTGLMDPTAAHLLSIAEALTVVLAFIEKHYSQLTATELKSLENVRKSLSSLTAYVRARWQEIQTKIDNSKYLSACPYCSQHSVVLQFKKAKCEFCQTTFTIDEFAKLFWSAIEDGSLDVKTASGPVRCAKCLRVSAVLDGTCLLSKHRTEDAQDILSCNATAPPSEDFSAYTGGDEEECPACGDLSLIISHMDGDAVEYSFYWLCATCQRLSTWGPLRRENELDDYEHLALDY